MAGDPRIRGEHSAPLQADIVDAGSSPHTRGALVDLHLCVPPGRIIPAYAGSTWKSRWCVVQERDHPRIRGEHHAILCTKVRDKGSSPHTRGALTEDYDEVIAARIIPAYAGSTSLWILTRRWRWDHPRIRGEHRAELYEVSVVAGSSPHTRGAQHSTCPASVSGRIIPAYAGSTSSPSLTGAAWPDHPRIRGEHRPVIFVTAGISGSSPHTRGAQA